MPRKKKDSPLSTYKVGSKQLVDSGGVLLKGKIIKRLCYKCGKNSILCGFPVNTKDKTPLLGRNRFPMQICANGCGWTAAEHVKEGR